ncbi:MAG: AEC family transporter [Pseudomonadota bacterium]
MWDIIQNVLPVFMIMGGGYLAARTGYIKADISDNLNALAVKIAVPILLFKAMYELDFAQAFYAPMLISFYAGAIGSFVLGIILARMVWKRRPGEAVAVGFCALFSNTVLLGIPIYQRAFGEDALAPVFGIIAFHAGLAYCLGIIVMELARRDGRPLDETFWNALKSIVSNPLMIGVIIGATLNLFAVVIPEPVSTAVNMVAGAAIPIALIGVGAALTRYQFGSEISESLMVSSLSLIVHPVIALVLSHYVFGLPIEYVQAAVVIAAMPPGLNIYIFAAMYNRAVSLSASTLIVSTLLSVVTITGWLFIVRSL